MQFKVLVNGDRLRYQGILSTIDSLKDCQILWTASAQEALKVAGEDLLGLALIDLQFEGRDGFQLLKKLRGLNRGAKILAMTADQSVGEAIRVIKMGADDYLSIPSDLPRLGSTIEETYRNWKVEEEEGSYGRRKRYGFERIVGDSSAMKKVCEIARKVSGSQATTVLLRGETGTGKELIARAIHYNSSRGDQPFVEVNCTAIPDTLLEAELFGHERGAFTDAKSQRKGFLELADGGTLFLDEIGTTGLSIQAKLLKSIEQKTFTRLGGAKEIEVDLRIVAATNRDLEQALREQAFREDLYYRLDVVSVELPPLRKRGNDVIILANHFLEQYNQEFDRKVRGFSEEAEKLLTSYNWPGNVRELKNVVERAVLLGDGDLIEPDHLSEHIRPRTIQRPSGVKERGHVLINLPVEELSFQEVEKRLVEQVLEIMRGNKNGTARILGISRPRLVRMIRKYGLTTKNS